MVTDTSEKAFQNEIIAHLTSTGYHQRGNANYNQPSGLDPQLVLKFVKESQPSQWKKYERHFKDNAEQKFLFRLITELNKKGTIEILRNGFKDYGCIFKLFYPRPNNKKNPDLFEKSEKNIFSVIDELEYEAREKGNRLDLVIFINGIPIITIELKDTFSQGVEKAITQYKKTRDPRELIFQRTFVHFAMSDEKIFMATKLDGLNSKFLPFNKALENPEVLKDYKTSYLYNDILQKNKLSKLIHNYVFWHQDGFYIFPRYHQLDCTHKLLSEAKPGKNYLIQHSAGSGKTYTIAWLAHGLINKFNRKDERIFDMVVVVSDRNVIDKQLQENIQSIEKVKGIVDTIDKDSSQLRNALKSGSNIIVTTIQKFPFVMDEIGKLPKRNYAVAIDEAHSSQSGTLAKKLKRVLAVKSLEEATLLEEEELDEIDEELLKEMESSKNLSNVSFFAFTATPKNKTLELFGTDDENGKPRPYHIYSMKQAIEEGFILDILANYLTYETYFKLVKKIEEDPEYEDKKAKRLLKIFVEKHPHAIDKKTEIMLNHFMSSSISKIKGQAKAMVVTRSRLHAVLYKRAFDKMLQLEKIPIKTLVAFTGIVKHDEQEYTEKSMNDIKGRKSIRKAFSEDAYKILIVANKFQTGFDQPFLHTMYIDKTLNGIQAVQTLSRANRIQKFKRDTLILDFANKTETIKKAFEPYFEDTFLKGRTDPHKLYDLQDKLLDYQIFTMDEVNDFVKSWKKTVKQSVLHNLMNPIVAEFKKLKKKDQVSFKKTLRRYQSIYSFLSQLIPFSDIDLEKLSIYNNFLIKKLPTINNPLPFTVMEDVDMNSYKIVDKGKKSISLRGDGELKPLSAGASGFIEEHQSKLTQILKDINDAFGTEFSEDDQVFINRVTGNLMDNKDLLKKIKNNSKENVKQVFEKYFSEEMTKLLNSNMNFYKRIVDNDKLKRNLKVALFDLVYVEYNKMKKKK